MYKTFPQYLLLLALVPALATADEPRRSLAELLEQPQRELEDGDPDRMYREGARLVDNNPTQAIYWFERAAEQGHVEAQSFLGTVYELGTTGSQDYGRAAKWHRLAAEQGDSPSQNSLGYLYSAGKGVPQDFSEALKWFHLAAKQGHPVAHLNLGIIYTNGEGTTQDMVTAHMWFNIAATNGQEASYRDRLADLMTPEQISQAQTRARRCFESNYQSCD